MYNCMCANFNLFIFFQKVFKTIEYLQNAKVAQKKRQIGKISIYFKLNV